AGPPARRTASRPRGSADSNSRASDSESHTVARRTTAFPALSQTSKRSPPHPEAAAFVPEPPSPTWPARAPPPPTRPPSVPSPRTPPPVSVHPFARTSDAPRIETGLGSSRREGAQYFSGCRICSGEGGGFVHAASS